LSLLNADLAIEKWFYTPDAGWYFKQEVAMDFSVRLRNDSCASS